MSKEKDNKVEIIALQQEVIKNQSDIIGKQNIRIEEYKDLNTSQSKLIDYLISKNK